MVDSGKSKVKSYRPLIGGESKTSVNQWLLSLWDQSLNANFKAKAIEHQFIQFLIQQFKKDMPEETEETKEESKKQSETP